MAALLLAGCAAGRPAPQATGTAGGAAAGAAAGALLGELIGGKAGTGAAIGGALGGLIGLVIASYQQAAHDSTGPTPSPEVARPKTDAEVARPKPTPSTPEVARPKTDAPPAGSRTGDPTKGELINATGWVVRVWVDPRDPAAPEPKAAILLQPRAKVARTLGVGTYRIVASAHAPAQGGERLVGRFDRTIEIEAWRPAWFLKFSDAEFQ
jgi:hypothetical protein